MPIQGNVPLAAGYLKLYARLRGLEAAYEIQILPTREANTLGDRALVEAILGRDPWMVGFSCYLWNIDRTLWIAQRLKQRAPDLRIILGGPEITADNEWVLAQPWIDYFALGEGEQTFADLLAALATHNEPQAAIDGLYPGARSAATHVPPRPRSPLKRLDEVSSPYLAGILDAREERTLLLETIRGCVFKCRFCYYPKSYDGLYFLSEEKIVANLAHASQRGAREVVLLDPTLNQRSDFDGFLALLERCNPDRQFTYFGELRAEGIRETTARLLRAANFTEVEIGLQSVDPDTQDLMDRRNNMRAFERGVRALLDVGIQVKVDLIIGLPGDGQASVRRGLEYLHESGLYSTLQVFNLAILPGTAFRQEAATLGLRHQARPPYYVLQTPSLEAADMYGLMHEAQSRFGVEYDPLPAPVLQFAEAQEVERCYVVDLDDEPSAASTFVGRPHPLPRAQAFCLWLRAADHDLACDRACRWIEETLAADPHLTLQVVLETTGPARPISPETLEMLASACFRDPSYLDRFYAVMPGDPKSAKRLVILLPWESRGQMSETWMDEVSRWATLAWHGAAVTADGLEPHEYIVSTDQEWAT